jgi:hypothetical protein
LGNSETENTNAFDMYLSERGGKETGLHSLGRQV